MLYSNKFVKISSSVTIVALYFLYLQRLERKFFYRYLNMASGINQMFFNLNILNKVIF
jgi:hypothetical protein